MIGVVIPAHNEEAELPACLKAVAVAAAAPALGGETVHVVVVLDACSDGTARIAHEWGVATLSVDARNVGIARSAGAHVCLQAGARWLAFTDADTVVSADWLVAQLEQRSDVVCGTVGIRDWSGHRAATVRHHRLTYLDADGHRHIHGANLGVSAQAYVRAGGFQPLESSEDVALVQALQTCGASIAWSAAPRVATSTRRLFRAPDGFGATLSRVDSALAATLTRVASSSPLSVSTSLLVPMPAPMPQPLHLPMPPTC